MANKSVREKPKKTKTTTKSSGLTLREISPKTETQRNVMQSYEDGQNMFLFGSAGTGKSFLACYLGMKDVLAGLQQKLIIVRSAVSSREIGYLPGNLHEKTMVYEAPYIDILSNLLSRGDAWSIATTKGMVNFTTTSHLRGMTIDNAVVFVDEIQNCNFQELETVITRLGSNSRIIMSGDIDQNDLYRHKNDQSGFQSFIKIVETMKSFNMHCFGEDDIVRGGLVKEYIKAKNRVHHLVK